MKKQSLFFLLTIANVIVFAQQKPVTTLQVPGKDLFAKINEKGISVLPSGRFLTPAGNLIRITNDPFGLAIAPNGKKAVTLHNGVFTVIDLAALTHT